MHHDQIPIDDDLVRNLVDDQFPQWAGLPLTRVDSTGTENAMYRLGPQLAVRMPLRPGKGEQVRKEQRWLPRLAPALPLPTPVPVGAGTPSAEYPSPWSVCRWLPGRDAVGQSLNLSEAARQLAAFIVKLRALDAGAAPLPGAHNFQRGVDLVRRDEQTRAALVQCEGLLDVRAAKAAWDRALAVPAYAGEPVWIHGDLTPANLLAEGGSLRGVIDWGGLGAGDPATDLLPAWNLFLGESRAVFRQAVGADDAAWARGRGLALSVGLVAYPYYLHSNPAMTQWALGMIREAIAP